MSQFQQWTLAIVWLCAYPIVVELIAWVGSVRRSFEGHETVTQDVRAFVAFIEIVIYWAIFAAIVRH